MNFRKLTAQILFFSLISIGYADAKNIIIDTDLGVDDAVAILYLGQKADIDIKAISISANGVAHCKPALKNAMGLLELIGKPDIRSACGRYHPLVGNHHYPKLILQQSDTLGGTSKILNPKNKKQTYASAVDLLHASLKNSATPIDIISIGSLTNLAELISNHPSIKSKIRMIYIMGGAINVPGNIALVDPSLKNHAAEWNIYIDPTAADIVFRSGIPLTLVPLDVTNQLPVDMAFAKKAEKYQKGKAGKFFYQLIKNNLGEIRAHQWYFWDPLTAVIASDESIATFKNMKLRVLLKPEEYAGATIVDNKLGHDVRVCVGVDVKRFKETLLKVINSGD